MVAALLAVLFGRENRQCEVQLGNEVKMHDRCCVFTLVCRD
jgi:hypothetical protein